jgi:hypothetical protein
MNELKELIEYKDKQAVKREESIRDIFANLNYNNEASINRLGRETETLGNWTLSLVITIIAICALLLSWHGCGREIVYKDITTTETNDN